MAAVASSDTSCTVTWIDQFDLTRFRVWTAGCSIDSDNRVKWSQDTPDSIAIPYTRAIALAPGADSPRFLYETNGTLYLSGSPTADDPWKITLDQDYVRSFTIGSDSGQLHVATIAVVSDESAKKRHAVVVYDLVGGRFVRSDLGTLTLPAGWMVYPPSLLIESDSLRLLVGLDHGRREADSTSLTHGSAFLSWARDADSSSSWTSPAVFLRKSSSQSRHIGSFAAIPGAANSWILSNGGLHLIRSADGRLEEIQIGSAAASGDAYGQPRVAAVALNDSIDCLAWIDAERQMLGGGALLYLNISPTLYGGDIRYAFLNTRRWTLTETKTVPMDKSGTAEALELARVGGKVLLVWGGPPNRSTLNLKKSPPQTVSAMVIQPATDD